MNDDQKQYRQVRWKNFKGFADTDWITIKPLTILIGANGSGKSSLIRPLLMLSQTLASSDSETALITQGELIDGSGYSELVHDHKTNEPIYFGFRFSNIYPANNKPKAVGSYPAASIELTFDYDKSFNGFSLKSFCIKDMLDRIYIQRNRLKDGSFSAIRKHKRAKEITNDEKLILKSSRPINFLFSPASELRNANKYISTQNGSSSKEIPFSNPFQHYLFVIGYTFAEVRRELGSLSYIGPLRERPKRIYTSFGAKPRNVGSTGAMAPHLLRRKPASVQSKVNKWVRRFGLGTQVKADSIADTDLFSLKFLDKNNIKSNLADKGFGASQVFPLIVELMAGEKGGLVVAEQPEIHLNPKLQCELADLFVDSISSSEKSALIVETHSEHLLLRLRRLVAEGKISKNDVAVYFLEKTESSSEIRPIPIDSIGAIKKDAWPRDFFQDGLREALGLAKAQAARKGES